LKLFEYFHGRGRFATAPAGNRKNGEAMKSLRSASVKAAAAKARRIDDSLDGLLGRLERGDVRVPVARKGRPAAMLISMSEYARLRAIDESPHAEIIGRLLFAR